MKVHEALNLYKLHNKPEHLDKHDVYQEKIGQMRKRLDVPGDALVFNTFADGGALTRKYYNQQSILNAVERDFDATHAAIVPFDNTLLNSIRQHLNVDNYPTNTYWVEFNRAYKLIQPTEAIVMDSGESGLTVIAFRQKKKVHEALSLYNLHSKPETLKGHDQVTAMLNKKYNFAGFTCIEDKQASLDKIIPLSKAITFIKRGFDSNYHEPFLVETYDQQHLQSILNDIKDDAEPPKYNTFINAMAKFQPASMLYWWLDDGGLGLIVTNCPQVILQQALDI